MSAEHVCQNKNHTGETPAFGILTIHFWYGSKNDMKAGSVHLCDECSDKLIKTLKKEYGVEENFLKNVIEM